MLGNRAGVLRMESRYGKQVSNVPEMQRHWQAVTLPGPPGKVEQMDTIDWTKPIEVLENNEWHTVEFVATDEKRVCFRDNGRLRLWVVGDDDIRNVPPVPAPAACSHFYLEMVAGKGFVCRKCGQTVPTVAPSPSPAPDSVAQAKRLVAEYGSGGAPDANAWCKFLSLYIAEQTAQRKAAGELEMAATIYYSDIHFVKAVAADARCRAGKDGGK